MKAEYFQDIDTDTVYACVGPMGFEAMFCLRNPGAAGAAWEFLTPDSPTWDQIHQRIYRNPRVEIMNPDESPTRLPPLPEIPRGPFPEPKEHYLSKRPMDASKYPSVTQFLKARSDRTVTVFVVLSEDTYETSFGDGEFHYFDDVFLSSEDAQRYISENQKGTTRFHLRTMSVKLERKEFVFPHFGWERYDRHKVEDVLKALEKRLGI